MSNINKDDTLKQLKYDTIKSIINKTTFPISVDNFKQIRDDYINIRINKYIDYMVDKITCDIISSVVSNFTGFHIKDIYEYLIEYAPREFVINRDKYTNIIINKVKEKFPDVLVTLYHSNNSGIVINNLRHGTIVEIKFEWPQPATATEDTNKTT